MVFNRGDRGEEMYDLFNKDLKTILNRKILFKGIRYTIIIGLIISTILNLRLLNRAKLLKAVNNFHPIIFLDLIIILFLSWVVAGLRIKFLVDSIGHKISLKKCMLIFLEARFVSHVTPFATGGGPFQIYFLKKVGLDTAEASTVVLIQFVLRVLFLSLSTLLCLTIFSSAIDSEIIPESIFYILFSLILFLVILTTILIIFPGIMHKFINLVFSNEIIRRHLKNSYKIRKMIVRLKQEIFNFRKSFSLISQERWSLAAAGVCTVSYWLLIFSIAPIIFIGFGQPPNFIYSFVMQVLFFFIQPFMPTPGAAGIAELGFASLFISFLPNNIIGLVTIIWRFFTYYIELLIGGFLVIKTIGKKELGE
ncbi:MAG: lysylphosphatidylglycerol synthase transmembrane domain-containing protein [bacterium]